MKLNNLHLISLSVFICLIMLSPILKAGSQHKGGENILWLKSGWFIQSSDKLADSGSRISMSDYKTADWYPTDVPSTVLGTLVKNGVYKDIFMGRNLASIPVDQFKKSWWYRKEFILPKKSAQTSIAKLEFDGINYRANIWVNGTLVAKSDSVEGAFRRFSFDVSNLIRYGENNTLAVEVLQPVPGEPTMGFVDWNPKAPDRNMGLWRGVSLRFSGNVSINNPFVKTKLDLETLKKASLTVLAEVENNSGNSVSGILSGVIGSARFSKTVELGPKEVKRVEFSPEEFKALVINNPKLWWTNDLGKPELNTLKLEFKIKSKLSDKVQTRFGIREVSDYFTEDGHRGYKLNGKKILIRGGGWVDNLLLDNTFDNYKAQVSYAKHMNLNTIRLEGFWGTSEDLYNLCDENGILLMAGWSCQWEWPGSLGKETDEFGGIKTPEDMKLIAQSWSDQVKWLRNHPSIFVWLYGSDKTPRPELESRYQDILKNEDPTRPFLAAASGKNSTVTGKTGVKMLGPYDYVTPNYWYIDKKYGGAYGFNTETGPGPQVPPIETIKKMIPQDSLWPVGKIYDYHCGGNDFNTLDRYNEMMNQRMGKPADLEEYCWKSQYLNYEGMRAMFEAFGANRYKATGVIQWMYNAAWPKFWWQLYDYYLNPNGAFYGAKKACEPLHIQYNYATNGIDLINNTQKEFKALQAVISVFDFNLQKKYTRTISTVNLAPDRTENIDILPSITDLSKAYFVDLKLYDKEQKLVSSNFYCLSSKAEVLDTAKTNWYVTPNKEYGDFSELNQLQSVKLRVNEKLKKEGQKQLVTVELANPTDKLAFMINISVKNSTTGENVLPIFWNDNYISLLPGEKRTINGYYFTKDLEASHPQIVVTGWNVK
ncbi:MAG: glycoside hydrolase family 2 TIM barrel-domain containing protein [Bacteroidota bacterium]|nr:glycoside hydrolase family 2 TIM barrel-domain containing protein [Bacteroidota bacterium]MDP4195355.1 glycoside hydrolase family 2 TIM barrel-domain containing protein [Bacteroidota bacterium]